MIDPNAFAERLRQDRIVAIVRAAGGLTATVDAVRAGGVGLVEISLTSRDALEAIRSTAADGMVGAGTVRNAADAERAVEAGASFLVSPRLNPDVLEWCRTAGVAHLPGVLTPTEIDAAARHGLTQVKLFPASLGGPAYVAALRGPYPSVGLAPGGG